MSWSKLQHTIRFLRWLWRLTGWSPVFQKVHWTEEDEGELRTFFRKRAGKLLILTIEQRVADTNAWAVQQHGNTEHAAGFAMGYKAMGCDLLEISRAAAISGELTGAVPTDSETTKVTDPAELDDLESRYQP